MQGGTSLPDRGQAQEIDILKFVCELDFMVKLLRACVWMPWRKQAMKDVVSCDKPRGDANSLRSGDFRMGKPNRCEHLLRLSE
jgi:hypothetical protein